MTALQPKTIYESLFSRVLSACKDRADFLDRGDLAVRSLYRDAEKLRGVDFDRGTAILAILDSECGDQAGSEQRLALLQSRNPGSMFVTDLKVTASYRWLRPSLVANDLDSYTTELHPYLPEAIPQIMAIGAYQHFLKAADTLQRAGLQPEHEDLHEGWIQIARKLEQLGVPESDTTAIVETAGQVLDQYGVKCSELTPDYTVQPDEVGAWFKVHASAEQAAMMDDDLHTALIGKQLDTVPFFVSFMGVGA